MGIKSKVKKLIEGKEPIETKEPTETIETTTKEKKSKPSEIEEHIQKTAKFYEENYAGTVTLETTADSTIGSLLFGILVELRKSNEQKATE